MAVKRADIVALALDQSPTATGWAIGRPNDTKPVFGTYRLSTWGDDEGARMASYEKWLMELAGEYKVTSLYYEAPFLPGHSNLNAIRPQFFVMAVINLVAAKLSLDVAEVRIDDWRKWAFGYCRIPGLQGDAARKEWKRLAKVRCLKNGLMVEDDNAAEAALILDFGLSDADYMHRRASNTRHRKAELEYWMGDRR